MDDHGIFQDALVILVAAIVFVPVFRRLRASPVVGYLAAGVLIGPYGIGLIDEIEGTRALAELGVVFLLFSIGLELSFKRLKTMRMQVFGLGSAQVVVTGLAVGTIAAAAGAGVPAAVVIGCGFALSSTAIVLQLLAEQGELSGRVGRTSFAILLLQDLAVVPMLAVVPLLGGEQAADWTVTLLAVAKAAMAVVVIILAGRLVLRPLFRLIAAARQSEVTVAASLLAILGTGWATEAVGLSLTLGAFLAGLLLAETEFRHQVEADIQPFRGLLLGLFFITIGMSIDLRFALSHYGLILMLLAGLFVLKGSVLWVLCRLNGLPGLQALRIGLLLAQGGEFAFILIGLGMQVGVVPSEVGQICLVLAGLSMALTPFLSALGRWTVRRFEKVASVGLAALEEENMDLEGHVVIGGFGRVGQAVARLLDARKIPYVALDMDGERVLRMRTQGRPIFYGDASRPDLLWGVGIDRARAALVSMDDPDAAGRMVERLRRGFPDMAIVARAKDEEHGQRLTSAGANSTVAETLEVSLQLGAGILRNFGIPDSDLGQLFETIRAER